MNRPSRTKSIMIGEIAKNTMRTTVRSSIGDSFLAVCFRPTIGQAGQLGTYSILLSEVEVGEDITFSIWRLRQHDSPRIDDHRTAQPAQFRCARAHLIGSDQEELIFDRSRLYQHFPMVATGTFRKSRGQCDQTHPPKGEDTKQLGETQVEADCQS